jgi:hypothetical protein
MDASQITDYLYISRRVYDWDVPLLQEMDIRLAISMIAHLRPPKALRKSPVGVLHFRTFDFPLLPIPVKTLTRGVESALPVIHDGHKVLVFCEAGRHRSVAMAASILIGMGLSAEEAMDLILEKRRVADPYASHIQRQIRNFETDWSQRN